MAAQEQNEPPGSSDNPDDGGLSPAVWVIGFVVATLILVLVFAAI